MLFSDVSLKINGELTLGENIADNGGLREAYYAYRLYVRDNGKERMLPGFENYTHEQLLFISFGNVSAFFRNACSYEIVWQLLRISCSFGVRHKRRHQPNGHWKTPTVQDGYDWKAFYKILLNSLKPLAASPIRTCIPRIDVEYGERESPSSTITSNLRVNLVILLFSVFFLRQNVQWKFLIIENYVFAGTNL